MIGFVDLTQKIEDQKPGCRLDPICCRHLGRVIGHKCTYVRMSVKLTDEFLDKLFYF